MSYFQLLSKRYDQLLQTEWDYGLEFVDYKRELYGYRFRRYNLFHWWALFIWVVAFYFNYSVLRFAIYALGLSFRLLFLPLRVAVEQFVAYSPLRKFLLFFCAVFETVGGITWLRLRLLDLWDRRQARWDARKAAFLQTWGDEHNNPIVRTAERLVRFDQRLRRLEKRTVHGLIYRLYYYWLRYRIPYYYRTVLHGLILSTRLLRYRHRRFYKWELRDTRLIYHWDAVGTGIHLTQLGSGIAKVVLYFRGGFRMVALVGRFLRELFSFSPLVGRRLRRPAEGRSHRFRISRYFPRKYSGSFRTLKDQQQWKDSGSFKEPKDYQDQEPPKK